MQTRLPVTDINDELRESDVQRMFDDWGDGRDGWRVFAPDWLMRCGKPESRDRVWGYNFEHYHFIPDAVWRTPEWLVLEVKRAAKMEPLALAEVLHHAWELGEQQRGESARFPVPVVVVSANNSGAWMRSALRYLFEAGLQPAALRYLEASYYRTDDGQRYIWFEEPFSLSSPSTPPPIVPPGWEQTPASWHKLATSDSWIGLPDTVPHVPASVPERFCMVSRAHAYSEWIVYTKNGDEYENSIWTTTSE